jgi:hypothetical protein
MLGMGKKVQELKKMVEIYEILKKCMMNFDGC